MLNPTTRTVFDVVTDFLATEPSAQEIIAYHLPDDIQQRADYLAEQNGEDALTYAERQELDEYLKVNLMFSLLKTKMKLKLKKQAE